MSRSVIRYAVCCFLLSISLLFVQIYCQHLILQRDRGSDWRLLFIRNCYLQKWNLTKECIYVYVLSLVEVDVVGFTCFYANWSICLVSNFVTFRLVMILLDLYLQYQHLLFQSSSRWGRIQLLPTNLVLGRLMPRLRQKKIPRCQLCPQQARCRSLLVFL